MLVKESIAWIICVLNLFIFWLRVDCRSRVSKLRESRKNHTIKNKKEVQYVEELKSFCQNVTCFNTKCTTQQIRGDLYLPATISKLNKPYKASYLTSAKLNSHVTCDINLQPLYDIVDFASGFTRQNKISMNLHKL